MNYQNQERVTYNNNVTVMGRVANITDLPDSQYNGQVQKRKEITLVLDDPDPQKAQRLTMLVGGRLAEFPIRLDDVKLWSFNFKGKEYNSRNYNNLYCWRITALDGGLPYPVQQQSPQTPTPLATPQQKTTDFDF